MACGGCCGCGTLILTPLEYRLLMEFAQNPFCAALFSERGGEPVRLGAENEEGTGEALRALERKRILTIDEDIPLRGFAYEPCPNGFLQGSMALTAYGQQVIDHLERQGFD